VSRLQELLLEWEERREAGQPVSAEDLCADCPDLLPELRRRIAQLEQFPTVEEAEGPPPEAPPAIGGYVVKRVLGTGATGIVYLAKDRALRRKVAIKVLSPHLGFVTAHERQRLARRFEREAQTLANLRHEAIVPVFEAELGRGEPYFVMEYQPGGSLQDRLREAAGKPAGATEAATFLLQVALAVCHAHANGVLHRDLKPGNILLDAQGRPKVSDFGLAKLLDDALLARDDSSALRPPSSGEESTATQPGRQPGTPAYMAPEQFDGRFGPIGLPADMWALGAILYELLAGRRAFPGETRLTLYQQICNAPIVPLGAIQPGVDPALERVALHCLSRDPRRRPTAPELARALTRYLRPGPVQRLADAAGRAAAACRAAIARGLRLTRKREVSAAPRENP
jgi:serine/threonine-protein kinase